MKSEVACRYLYDFKFQKSYIRQSASVLQPVMTRGSCLLGPCNCCLVLMFAAGSGTFKRCSWGERGGQSVWVMCAPQATFTISLSGILSERGERAKTLSRRHWAVLFYENICTCACCVYVLSFIGGCVLISSALICRWILPISSWAEEWPVRVSFKRKSVFWSTQSLLFLAFSLKPWITMNVWSSQVSKPRSAHMWLNCDIH